MTDRVKKALKVISPPPEAKSECERLIGDAIRAIHARVKLDRQAKSLRSAEADKTLRKLIPLLESLSHEGPFIYALEHARGLIKQPLRPGRDADAERIAIQHAAMLLALYGRELTTTRGGKWDELSVTLLGGRQETLSRHLAEMRNKGTYQTLAIARKRPQGRKPKARLK